MSKKLVCVCFCDRNTGCDRNRQSELEMDIEKERGKRLGAKIIDRILRIMRVKRGIDENGE